MRAAVIELSKFEDTGGATRAVVPPRPNSSAIYVRKAGVSRREHVT